MTINENEHGGEIEEDQRFGELRAHLAKLHGIPVRHIHLFADGKAMFDSDKLKPNDVVTFSIDEHGRGSNIRPIKLRDYSRTARESKRNNRRVWTRQSRRKAASNSTKGDHRQQRNKASKSLDWEKLTFSEYPTPPPFANIQFDEEDGNDELSLEPHESYGSVGQVDWDERENSERYQLAKLAPWRQYESAANDELITLRRKLKDLTEKCNTLQKYNFILRLYDARVPSSINELRGIVRFNFERRLRSSETLDSILISECFNEDDPEGSLDFRSNIGLELSEINSDLQETMRCLQRSIERWDEEEFNTTKLMEENRVLLSKNLDLRNHIENIASRNMELRDSVKIQKLQQESFVNEKDNVIQNFVARVNGLKDELKSSKHEKELFEKKIKTQEAELLKDKTEIIELKKQLTIKESLIRELKWWTHVDKVRIRNATEKVEHLEKLLEAETNALLSEKGVLAWTAQTQWDRKEFLRTSLKEHEVRVNELQYVHSRPIRLATKLWLLSPFCGVIFLFVAWEEIVRNLSEIREKLAILVLLTFAAGLFLRCFSDYLHCDLLEDYLDWFDVLVAKFSNRLLKRLIKLSSRVKK